MTHLELFAGIGGFRRAFDLIQQDLHIPMECVGFSEIDQRAITTYKANYNPRDWEDLGDIVALTQDRERLDALPDFDILTGGFPCQTFSIMGDQAGFEEETRGQMFFRIMDILESKRRRNALPRYVILENVRNLKNHDKGRTFARVKKELENLGYDVMSKVFNTAKFHLPQKRSRIIIVAILGQIPAQVRHAFEVEDVTWHLYSVIYRQASTINYDSVIDVLDKQVDPKYFLSERVKPTILSDGTGGYRSNSTINHLIARPLTASMHKMHRACQDNYYSNRFILSDGNIDDSLGMTKEQIALLPIRKLTPEEAFMLQGFPREFVDRAREYKVSDGALYKQAGNAVSVNVIYAVMRFLILNNIIENHGNN